MPVVRDLSYGQKFRLDKEETFKLDAGGDTVTLGAHTLMQTESREHVADEIQPYLSATIIDETLGELKGKVVRLPVLTGWIAP